MFGLDDIATERAKDTTKSKEPIAIFLADLHWTTLTPAYRKERGCFSEVIAKKLRVPLDMAVKHSIPVFIAGDVFDRTREFIDMWTLKEFLRGYDSVVAPLRVYAIRGQHDLFHHDRKNKATNFNAIRGMLGDVFRGMPDDKVVKYLPLSLDKYEEDEHIAKVFGCGYYDDVPEPTIKKDHNILLWHKGLWRGKDPYPGAKDGNVESISVQLKELGYDIVFAGDYHKQWDARIGGVQFYNLGCFVRKKVNENELPRFCVLYDDLSVESVYVGEKDVFDIVGSDSDKARGDVKDEFSDALVMGYKSTNTIDDVIDNIINSGKCNEIVLTDRQLAMLRDMRAASKEK